MKPERKTGLSKNGASLASVLVFLFSFIGPDITRANVWIYTDSLQNGWQNWSWATVNFDNSSPVYFGSRSISVTMDAWQAVYVHHAAFDSSPYVSISLWINGGTSGGQELQLAAELNGAVQSSVSLAPLAANTWQPITISLASLGVANRPDLDGFWIQDRLGAPQPTFYVDEAQLTVVPEPSAAALIGLSLIGLRALHPLVKRRSFA